MNFLESWLIKEMIPSVSRAVINAAGGWLLAHGVSDQLTAQFTSTTTEVVAAVGLFLLANGWSFVEKKLSKS